MKVLGSSEKKVGMTFEAKPIPKEFANNFRNQLLAKNVKTVDLYCHCSPDEDTVNAMKVMYNWLKSHGKKVKACLDSIDTDGLYLNKLFYHIKDRRDKSKPDKSLCLDFNASERIPNNYDLVHTEKNMNNILGFDHHTKTDSTLESDNLYIDDSAASCCGVVYRFFESLGEKLSNKDLKSLYCGMLSDYRGSKLANIKKTDSGYELIKHQALLEDKNSLDVLNKIESALSEKDKNKIYKHLDVLSKLDSNEQRLMAQLPQDLEISYSHNFAYIFIEPEDKLWAKAGYDNVRTSAILKEIRTRALDNFPEDETFTPRKKERLKDIKAVAIFYRTDASSDSAYQVSIHSKEGYAEKLIEKVNDINPEFSGGGHPDRAGGRIYSIEYDDTIRLVEDFLKADAELSKKAKK